MVFYTGGLLTFSSNCNDKLSLAGQTRAKRDNWDNWEWWVNLEWLIEISIIRKLHM
jgi:hypothetical protein